MSATHQPKPPTDELTSSEAQPKPATDELTSSEAQPKPATNELTSSEVQAKPFTSRLTSSEAQPKPPTSRLTSSKVQPKPATSQLTSSEVQPKPATSRLTSSEVQPKPFTSRLTSSKTQAKPPTQYLQRNQKGGLGASAQSALKLDRSLLLAILSLIRQSDDLDSLLNRAVTAVRENLRADRALIYRFSALDWGAILAESLTEGWTPCLGKEIPAIGFGLAQKAEYLNQQPVTIDRIEGKGEKGSSQLTPYQIQLLERFQVKASLSLPILVEGEVWGLLAVQQCSGVRHWEEAEINLLYPICAELAIVLHRAEFCSQLQEQAEAERTAAKIIDQVGRFVDLETIFATVTKEVRTFLRADRVAVFRFDPDQSGEFVAESVGSGWTSIVSEQDKIERLKPAVVDCQGVQYLITSNSNGQTNRAKWADTYLQETKSSVLQSKGIFVREDIYQAGFPYCYLEVLEQYEVKAYATIPIFQGEKLWGLLATYQNSGPRAWQDWEVRFLWKIGTLLSVALQQAETLEQVRSQSNQLAQLVEQEQAVAKVIERIRRSVDVETIFETTTREVRLLLSAERVAVYRFNPDWSGEFVAESVVTGWSSLVEKQDEIERLQECISDCRGVGTLIASNSNGQTNRAKWADTYWQETQGGQLRSQKAFVREDIYKAGFSPCYIEVLEQYQARAYAIVPVFQREKLWGLLAAFQNDRPRAWQETEVKFLEQIATQLGVALQQGETFEQVQAKSNQLARLVEQEQAVAKVIGRIRQSIELETIFETTTREVRLLLSADRVAVYRFDSDWSGEFVAESVASGWSYLVEKQQQIPRLQESISNCRGVGSIIAASSQEPKSPALWTDTYLQKTQGAPLKEQKAFVREDIYQAGFSSCYIEVLEQYEVRAYVIVPVFQGQKLWGMLAAFQNDGPRVWQETEVKFLEQIGDQFSVAVQQAEYVNQIRAQSQAQAKQAEREKNFVRFLVKINQQIVEQSQQKLTLESLLRTNTYELRKLLKADRVAIYRFNPDWSSELICENISAGCLKLVGTEAAIVEDPDLQETKGGRYRNHENLVVNDIDSAELSTFELEWFEELGIKACAITPIFEGERLWGLLATYQNDCARLWEESEMYLLTQASVQLGVAIQQADYLEQVQGQSQQLARAVEREKTAKEQLQQRAAQLLIAVKPAFTGDLTVRAPITEDEIGTIADAYNGTLQSLRKIVLQVQAAAKQVVQTTEGNGAAVEKFSAQAQQQFQQLNRALDQIQQVTNSTEVAAESVQQVEAAVQQANQTLEKGDSAMNLTVGNILTIRETVSETAKRIKRLRESSQKISKVVQLINNFATQTNLLAMNAALEATRGGGDGRGLSVIAEEVRSLSHQSTAATTEIEELVLEIQTETAEVSKAMDIGLERVLEGTGLVDESRESLNAIVAATDQISKLVEEITRATQVQREQAETVTQVMKDVGAIANQTSQDSIEISESFQGLLALAQDLNKSTGQFKVN